MSQRRWSRPVLLVLSTVASAAIGWIVITAFRDHTAQSRRYTGTPQFKVWSLIIGSVWAALPTMWSIGLAQLRTSLRATECQDSHEPLRQLRRHAGWLAAAVVAVAAVAWGSGAYANPGNFQLYYLGLPRIVLTYAAVVIGLYPVFLTFWVVYRQLAPSNIWSEVDEARVLARIEHVAAWRSAMMTGLTAAGAVVSLGVLATGAQREALLAVHADPARYPPTYVIVWGIAASAVLLAGFVPAYRRVSTLGAMTIDTVFPLVAPGEDGWRDRLTDRAALADLLKIDQSLSGLVNSALVVAAPLLSAAFSLLLPSAG